MQHVLTKSDQKTQDFCTIGAKYCIDKTGDNILGHHIE